MAAMVAPLGCLSRSRTASCLVPRAEIGAPVRGSEGPFAPLSSAGGLGLYTGFVLRHFWILFGCGASCAVTTEAPQAASPAGQDPERGRLAPFIMSTVTLPSGRKSTPFCDENLRRSLPAGHPRGASGERSPRQASRVIIVLCVSGATPRPSGLSLAAWSGRARVDSRCKRRTAASRGHAVRASRFSCICFGSAVL